MAKFENFVRCTLESAITDSQTTIRVEFADPWQEPPDPAGEIARMTLTDSLTDPSAFEIITYTGVSAVSAGVVDLTGVSRGEETTLPAAWDAGDFAVQDVTAETLQLLELQDQQIFVYVANGDTTLRKLTPEGEVIWTFNSPQDDCVRVAVGIDGSSYVLSVDDTLRKVDPDGNQVWSESVGSSGVNDYLVVDNQGNTYHAERSSNEVTKRDPDGNSLWVHDFGEEIRDIAVDRDQNLFVGTIGPALYRVSPDGDVLWSANPPFATLANAVSAPGNGFVYVADAETIYKMDYSGAVVDSVAEAQLAVPIKADEDGNLYYWRPGDSKVIKLDDSLTEVYESAASLSNVNGIDIDLHGSAYISGPNGVRKLRPDGSTEWTFTGGLSTYRDVGVIPLEQSMPARFSDSEWRFRHTDHDDVTNKPAASNGEYFKEVGVTPDTPPTDHCVLYADTDGAFKVKFDDGTVETLAAKP